FCGRHIDCNAVLFFQATATTQTYTLSLHDALPISAGAFAEGPYEALRPELLSAADQPVEGGARQVAGTHVHRLDDPALVHGRPRSEEHTSELQSRSDLVCRLLLEKKKH